jgi:hypothetical protein
MLSRSVERWKTRRQLGFRNPRYLMISRPSKEFGEGIKIPLALGENLYKLFEFEDALQTNML